jgi:very-short-patch-repair endonuclease
MRGPIITFKRARRLRREMSLPEVILWRHLRGHHLAGLRFRRQHPIGPYILDFYCAEVSLCVEVDGYTHDNSAAVAHDEERTRWLDQQGIRVHRVLASDVLDRGRLEAVCKSIVLAAFKPD